MTDSRYQVKRHCSGAYWLLVRRYFKGRIVLVGKYTDRDRAYRACRTLNSEGKY